MELSVPEAARLLSAEEHEVHGWIRRLRLPTHRAVGQRRIQRVELLEWALAQGRPLAPDLFASEGPPRPPELAAALERGGVHRAIAGTRREDVLAAVAALPTIAPPEDRPRLCELFLARRSLGALSVADGIALPRPREPLVFPGPEPRLALAFFQAPVDFAPPAGRSLRGLFVLVAPSVRVHLALLARLGAALHDPGLLALLTPATPPAAIALRLQVLETAWRRS